MGTIAKVVALATAIPGLVQSYAFDRLFGVSTTADTAFSVEGGLLETQFKEIEADSSPKGIKKRIERSSIIDKKDLPGFGVSIQVPVLCSRSGA